MGWRGKKEGSRFKVAAGRRYTVKGSRVAVNIPFREMEIEVGWRKKEKKGGGQA